MFTFLSIYVLASTLTLNKSLMKGDSRLSWIPHLFQRQVVTEPRNCREIAVRRGYQRHPSYETGATPRIQCHQSPEQLNVSATFHCPFL
jgi:hypothetical protein